MKHFARFFLILVTFGAFFLAQPVSAFEVRNADQVRVAEQDVISSSLVTGGTTIDIDGEVQGDLICAGQRITVRGMVDGDVLCIGQTIDIEGVVTGNVRVMAQTVKIQGEVQRNVTVLGQTLALSPESVIGGDVAFAVQGLDMSGSVGKSISGAAATASINGIVDGAVSLNVGTLTIGDGAHLIGAVSYTGEKEASISSNAVIEQPIVKNIVQRQTPKKSDGQGKEKMLVWPVHRFGGILSALVFGLLFVLLFPAGLRTVLTSVKEHPAKLFLIGAGIVCLVPILILMLCITIIGIPIAALVGVAFVALLLIGRVATAIFIGKELLSSFWKAKEGNMYIATCIGVPISWIAFSLPFVGWICSLAALLAGMGGIAYSLFLAQHGKK